MFININGKTCEAQEGEHILKIARRNQIYIPALCYLNGCTPTLACRLCMVEADGKRVYSCNAKAKDGMVVQSNTAELWAERNAIMQTYCINHPLQCGVCDKSGECELQNMTTRSRVIEQNQYIKDTHKPHKEWGLINYDPALCIVCERCATVCKDKIGESALKTVPRGSEPIAPEFKEKMSKDSYFIWNKFQKNLIGPAKGDVLDCSFCGECTSVCPTGALVGSHFQYTSNAWELTRIPAANPHSSDCEAMFYDIKQKSIANNDKKIYRVSNDFHFTALNRAARYGFCIQNEVDGKDEAAFEEALKAFKQSKNLKFNSYITNEEAYILNELAKKYNLALVNEEARTFQAFIKEYSSISGKMLESTSKDVKEGDFLVVSGTMLRYDAPNVSYLVNNALIMNKGSLLYSHPVAEDGANFTKNVMQINPAANSEEAFLMFLLQHFGTNLPASLKAKLDTFTYTFSKEVEESIKEDVKEIIKDENGEDKEVVKSVTKKIKKNIDVQASSLARDLGIDEEALSKHLAKKENYVLIIGSDYYESPSCLKLAKLLGLVSKYTQFKLFFIPPATNSVGVSLICDLSKQVDGPCFGYNEKADFSFSYEKGANLAACGLNQQEGSFVNYDLRLVPTNAALEFKGYFLNDLANALGMDARYTIDYTAKLPLEAGFKNIAFDDLKDGFSDGGEEKRGYLLERKTNSILEDETLLEEISKAEIKINKDALNDDEIMIYQANPIHQFSKLSNFAFGEVARLFMSKDLMQKFALANNDSVILSANGEELAISVELDEHISSFAYLPNFDQKVKCGFFTHGRFAKLALRRAK